MVTVLPVAGSSLLVMDAKVCYLRHSSFSSSQVHSLSQKTIVGFSHCLLFLVGARESERSESLPLPEDLHGLAYVFNFFVGIVVADIEPPRLAKRVPFVLFSRSPLSIPHLLCVATWELKFGQEMYVWARKILGGFHMKALIGAFKFILCNWKQLNPAVRLLTESWAPSKKRGGGVRGVREQLWLQEESIPTPYFFSVLWQGFYPIMNLKIIS